MPEQIRNQLDHSIQRKCQNKLGLELCQAQDRLEFGQVLSQILPQVSVSCLLTVDSVLIKIFMYEKMFGSDKNAWVRSV